MMDTTLAPRRREPEGPSLRWMAAMPAFADWRQTHLPVNTRRRCRSADRPPTRLAGAGRPTGIPHDPATTPDEPIGTDALII